MAKTFYGFLVDDALKVSTTLDLASTSDQGYGVLTGEPANYLVKKGVLNDSRSSRLALLENKSPAGQLAFWFDQNQVDLAQLQGLSEEDNTKLFNIIERLYLAQQYADSSIESQLTTDDAYDGYVALSLAHSTSSGTPVVFNVNKTGKECTIYDWYSFEFNRGTINFVLYFWVKRSAFAADYPFTTITKVIPPYAPSTLVDPVTLIQVTNLNVLANSSTYIFDQSNLEVAARDQNGVYKYSTKYVVSGDASVEIPFALTYCGAAVPSSLACRTAIREYLSANTSISDSALEAIFPDLFVSARFYVVPLYDLYSQLTDRDVYNSIINYTAINERAAKVFTDTDASFRSKYLEVILNAQNTKWSMVLPDELNGKILSVLAQHPTYVNYSTQVPGWKYMTATTQEFAGKLIRCMAVLDGDSTSTEFLSVTDGGRSYLTFTAGSAEYYVMTKESYTALITNS